MNKIKKLFARTGSKEAQRIKYPRNQCCLQTKQIKGETIRKSNITHIVPSYVRKIDEDMENNPEFGQEIP